MRKLDYILQKWRYSVVEPFIPAGCDLLDIGGFDGSFLARIYEKLRNGVCIDPHLEEKRDNKLAFVKARVDGLLPFPDESFDVITMLAVYEHLGEQRKLLTSESFRVCRKNGLVLLTVPSGAVDTILRMLMKIGLIEGMSIEEHQHFKVSETVGIFEEAGFQLKRWSRFQVGLNNFFVFQKGGMS
jgi:ubiquinone/menaquinone biosynthesis C-methylase UbiE